jgi:hypothetical protein
MLPPIFVTRDIRPNKVARAPDAEDVREDTIPIAKGRIGRANSGFVTSCPKKLILFGPRIFPITYRLNGGINANQLLETPALCPILYRPKLYNNCITIAIIAIIMKNIPRIAKSIPRASGKPFIIFITKYIYIILSYYL